MSRRFTIALATVAVFALPAVAGVAGTGDPGSPAAAAFRLADGSAGCNFRDTGEIACRAAGDGEAAVLSPAGDPSTAPATSVGWDRETPVLLAAESWWHGEFRCRVAASQIVCAAGESSIAVGSH
jgi:hypothetical protein